MIIRKLQLMDAEGMHEWMQDMDVTKNLAQDFSSKSMEDCKSFILNANADEESNLHRAICNDAGEYLGTVSLKHIDRRNKNAEYAISMRSTAIGTGASTFGTIEILKYAFDILKLEKVYLNVTTENIRAKKFYQKIGFQYEGTAKKHILINGKLCDLEWYAFYREMECELCK